MDCYVVRIYRRTGKQSRILIGTVEVAGTEKKMVFSNVEELWEILKQKKRRGKTENCRRQMGIQQHRPGGSG